MTLEQDDKNNITNIFASFIREKRIAMGLTLREFSELIYGDEKYNSYLSNIETGKKTPGGKTMQFILNKLNCRLSIEEL